MSRTRCWGAGLVRGAGAVRGSVCTAFLTALLAFVVIRSGTALEQTPSDLLRILERLEGISVTVRGSVRDLRTTVTRKGARYYTFYLSDKHASILVLTTALPACPVGATVVVDGRVTLVKQAEHQRIGRVDATRVVCVIDPASRGRPGRGWSTPASPSA